MTVNPVVVKVVTTVAIYGAWCALILFVFSQSVPPEEKALMTTLTLTMGVIFAPSLLGFGATAWLLRARWTGMGGPQILVATFFLAFATLVLGWALGLVFFWFAQEPRFTTRLVLFIMMLFPGIIAAQLLRLGEKRRKQEATTEGTSLDR
jgi:hypothetical protein